MQAGVNWQHVGAHSGYHKAYVYKNLKKIERNRRRKITKSYVV
jgi:hypothetical protein